MAKQIDQQKPLSTLALMMAVRDARCCRNAARQLLDAIVLRCSPERKYMCFPSYERLAEDTGLTVKTLSKAALQLSDANLVRRVERAYRSNKFYVNADLIMSMARDNRAKAAAKRKRTETDDCPFAPVSSSTSELDQDNGDHDAWEGGAA